MVILGTLRHHFQQIHCFIRRHFVATLFQSFLQIIVSIFAMIRIQDAMWRVCHRRRNIEIGGAAKRVLSGEHFHFVWMLIGVGICVFHNGIVAGGICHKEMVVSLLLIHTHIILLQHFNSFFHCRRPIENHSHSNSGKDRFLTRLLLKSGLAIELEHAHRQAIFVDAIQKQIRQSHQHRQIRFSICEKAATIAHKKTIN